MAIRRTELNLNRNFISVLGQRVTLFLLAFSLVSNACQQKPTNPPGTQSLPSQGSSYSGDHTFRLGVLGPFTGPAARTGQEFRNAVTMAFEDIDYRIGKYKVELVWI